MSDHSQFVARAREFRKRNDLRMAGEYYSIGGLAYLATTWDEIKSQDIGYLRKGPLFEGFVWQAYAATCYRVVGAPERAENRSKQAILQLEDARDTLVDHPAWIGLSWELEADLRVIAGLPEYRDAYDTALEYFREVESSSNESEILSWTTEPGFNETALYVMHVAEGVEREVELSTLRTTDGQPSLRKRVDYKREQLPGMLEKLADQGEWPGVDHDLPTIEYDLERGVDSFSDGEEK